eukprot:217927-Hanusia_phi.AAC.1
MLRPYSTRQKLVHDDSDLPPGPEPPGTIPGPGPVLAGPVNTESGRHPPRSRRYGPGSPRPAAGLRVGCGGRGGSWDPGDHGIGSVRQSDS